MKLQVSMTEVRSYVNSYGEDDIKTTIFGEWEEDTDRPMGEVFKIFQKEYGRCVSKVYRDIAMGDGTYHTVTSGWVFQKREHYERSKDTYLQEVWVSLK